MTQNRIIHPKAPLRNSFGESLTEFCRLHIKLKSIPEILPLFYSSTFLRKDKQTPEEVEPRYRPVERLVALHEYEVAYASITPLNYRKVIYSLIHSPIEF